MTKINREALQPLPVTTPSWRPLPHIIGTLKEYKWKDSFISIFDWSLSIHHFIFFSYRGKEYFGYSKKDIFGRSSYVLVHSMDVQHVRCKHTESKCHPLIVDASN